MRIAVDDSGQPTVAVGSSPTFSLGAVIFEHTVEADACDQTVENLKQALNVKEFHYADLTQATRTAFFRSISNHEFGYVVQTFVKSRRRHGRWNDATFFFERVAEKL